MIQTKQKKKNVKRMMAYPVSEGKRSKKRKKRKRKREREKESLSLLSRLVSLVSSPPPRRELEVDAGFFLCFSRGRKRSLSFRRHLLGLRRRLLGLCL